MYTLYTAHSIQPVIHGAFQALNWCLTDMPVGRPIGFLVCCVWPKNCLHYRPSMKRHYYHGFSRFSACFGTWHAHDVKRFEWKLGRDLHLQKSLRELRREFLAKLWTRVVTEIWTRNPTWLYTQWIIGFKARRKRLIIKITIIFQHLV